VIKAAKILMSVIGTLAIVFSVSAAMDEQSIAERLKPVGKVCVEGDDCGTASASTASGPKDPADIYQASCMACHGSGVLGAPKFGDAAAWGERLAKGIDSMTANAINGINAMPPKGTCASCSDEDIKATIQYILDNSK
jgi:cytochrome c5